ncbi:hypothetical protein [Acidovorax sp. LjRoot117]
MAELLQKSGKKVWQRLAAVASVEAVTAAASTVLYGIDGINLR